MPEGSSSATPSATEIKHRGIAPVSALPTPDMPLGATTHAILRSNLVSQGWAIIAMRMVRDTATSPPLVNAFLRQCSEDQECLDFAKIGA